MAIASRMKKQERTHDILLLSGAFAIDRYRIMLVICDRTPFLGGFLNVGKCGAASVTSLVAEPKF
jgi:hypothetical protein